MGREYAAAAADGAVLVQPVHGVYQVVLVGRLQLCQVADQGLQFCSLLCGKLLRARVASDGKLAGDQHRRGRAQLASVHADRDLTDFDQLGHRHGVILDQEILIQDLPPPDIDKTGGLLIDCVPLGVEGELDAVLGISADDHRSTDHRGALVYNVNIDDHGVLLLLSKHILAGNA